MPEQAPSNARRLRIALLWNEGIVDEQELEPPQSVVLGNDPDATFPLPHGVGDEAMSILEPHGSGYQLRLGSQMGGSVWLGGRRHEVGQLARSGATKPLGPQDYGVVTVGPVGIFFQQVRAARPPARRFFVLDGQLASGLGISAFVFVALLLLAFLDRRERPPEDPLELPSDLVAKYMVVPPPEEDVVEQKTRSAGTETKDPGLRARKETGAKRHKGPEGRVGRDDARREQTEIAGEVRDQIAPEVRNKGLLGALSGGNAISKALDVPKVSDMLSGMGVKTTRVGRGSAGASLRGSGSGGGGEGSGSLFGAGDVGTGLGDDKGGGMGRGGDGAGVPGRKAKEVEVSVKRGNAGTNGYLSPEQINRVVRAHQAAVRYCYETEVQRQPDLRGRIVINWRINLQGAVTSARVAKSTMNNESVEGCIVRQVRRWQFPEPDGGECVVNYPFIFGVKGG